MIRLRDAALGASLVIGLPRPAGAHLVSTGAGPFYDGAAHFVLSIEELLPVLALALLAGLRGPRASRWLLAILPAAWLVGGLIGLRAPMATPPAAVTTVLLIVAGALLAADRELPLPVVVGVTALLGLGVGALNGTAMAAASLGRLGLLGAVAAAIVLSTLAAAMATALRHGWARIAVRVAGSWIAALGVLALGWTLRG